MPCNKISFEDSSSALKEAKRIMADNKHFKNRSSRKANAKLKPYLCPRCSKYHLTSKKQNKR
jgi:hypothetical protein